MRKEIGSGREKKKVQNGSRADKGVETSKKEIYIYSKNRKGNKIVKNWDCILLFENINKIYQQATNL